METFGDYLQYLRRKCNFDQAELARRVGVSRTTISNWELGRTPPPKKKRFEKLVEQILEYVTPDEAEQLSDLAEKDRYQSSQNTKPQPTNATPDQQPRQNIKENLPFSPHSYYDPTPIRHYVPRQQELSHIQNTLLDPQSPRLHAICGMGGVGKTTLIRALCTDITYSGTISQRFPDGILQITLGKDANPIPTIRGWIECLGGCISTNVPTLEYLKVKLHELLLTRSCLLLIDDVWDISAVETFLVGGPQCRILFTTRKSWIAKELQASIISLNAMTEDEAITLIESRAGDHLKLINLEVKRQIVNRLGRLPLALQLVGSQLQSRSATKWLSNFDIRKIRSPYVENENLIKVFEMSLEDLTEEEYNLFVSLAIFQENEAIPHVTVEYLWSSMVQMDDDDTRELLHKLEDLSLIEGYFLTYSVRLHDLLHDFIVMKLREKNGVKQTHQSLLSRYRTQYQENGWHTLKDDGYIYDHLVYHLAQGEATQEIHELFMNHNWLHARISQCLYTYDGYLEDLKIGLKFAQGEVQKQIEANTEPQTFADCVRYLLIYTSINSVIDKHIPAIVGTALKRRHLSESRALNIANHSLGLYKKLDIYFSTLYSGQISLKEAQILQATILNLIKASNDTRLQVELIENLLPCLLDSFLEEMLDAILALNDVDIQARLIGKLIPQLTGPLLEKALNTTLAFDAKIQASLLLQFVPQLEEKRRTWALKKVLDIALTLNNQGAQITLLMRLIPHLTGSLLERVVTITLTFDHLMFHPTLLRELAPQLTVSLQERTINAILAINEPKKRITLLLLVVPQLEEQRRSQVLEKVLGMTLALNKTQDQITLLEQLIPYLTGPLLEKAFDVTLALDAEKQIALLVQFLPQLDKQRRSWVLEKFLDAILALDDPFDQIELLEKLIPQLHAQDPYWIFEKVLVLILSFEPSWDAVIFLSQIAPQLNMQHRLVAFEKALEFIPEIEVMPNQVVLLLTLAPQLDEPLRSQAFEEALHIILSFDDYDVRDYSENIQAELFEDLVSQLPQSFLEKVLNILLTLDSGDKQYKLVEKLAPYLTDTLVQKALDAALTFNDAIDQAHLFLLILSRFDTTNRTLLLEKALDTILSMKPVNPYDTINFVHNPSSYQASLLEQLAPYLTDTLLEKALNIILSFEDTEKQVTLLLRLIPQIHITHRIGALVQAFNMISSLNHSRYQIELFQQITPLLTEELIEKALNAFLNFDNQVVRAKLLIHLAPLLNSEKRSWVLEKVVLPTWEVSDLDTKVDLLKHLMPQLDSQHHSLILGKTLDEIMFSTFPVQAQLTLLRQIIPYTNKRQIEKIAASHNIFSSERFQVELMIQQAIQSDAERRTHILEKTFESISTFSYDASFQVDLLKKLLPILPDILLEKALETTLNINSLEEQYKIIACLMPRLSKELIEMTVNKILSLENRKAQVYLLGNFISIEKVRNKRLKLAQIIFDQLFELSLQKTREDFLYNLQQTLLFSTGLFSGDTLGNIAVNVIDVCTNWVWR